MYPSLSVSGGLVVSVPSAIPSFVPSSFPSSQPSKIPSSLPSAIPSCLPTLLPSSVPSKMPSSTPTSVPSVLPSVLPSVCDVFVARSLRRAIRRANGAPARKQLASCKECSPQISRRSSVPITQPNLAPNYATLGLNAPRRKRTPRMANKLGQGW